MRKESASRPKGKHVQKPRRREKSSSERKTGEKNGRAFFPADFLFSDGTHNPQNKTTKGANVKWECSVIGKGKKEGGEGKPEATRVQMGKK